MLTRTFQLASRPVARLASEVDPQNRLLHHYPARRLEAEAIRDSILAASGRLDRTLFGLSIQPYREKENADRRLFPGPLDGDGRRSIYIKNNLMEGAEVPRRVQFPRRQGDAGPPRRDQRPGPGPGPAQRSVRAAAGRRLGRSGWSRRPDKHVGAAASIACSAAALGRSAEPSENAGASSKRSRSSPSCIGVPAGDILKSRAVWKDVAHATVQSARSSSTFRDQR